ncbi:prostate stem cell antigen-like isoform X2 [Pleurodeles waltl]|uniref:prostate stem cell antigen-like isoform X2 n=1 Tax=Pleurodeles waltl TaxID=8319 RepID=UPI0037094994
MHLYKNTSRSLQCYNCDNQASEDTCLKVTTCTLFDGNICLTSVNVYPLLGTQISKRCALVCIPSSIALGGVGTTTTCCSTDLCNGIGSANVGISNVTIIPPGETTSSTITSVTSKATTTETTKETYKATNEATTRATNGMTTRMNSQLTSTTTNLVDIIIGLNGAISLKISYIVLAATACFVGLLFRGVL